jgi:hypothetical protein
LLLQGLGGSDSKNKVTEFEVTRLRYVKSTQFPSETELGLWDFFFPNWMFWTKGASKAALQRKRSSSYCKQHGVGGGKEKGEERKERKCQEEEKYGKLA